MSEFLKRVTRNVREAHETARAETDPRRTIRREALLGAIGYDPLVARRVKDEFAGDFDQCIAELRRRLREAD